MKYILKLKFNMKYENPQIQSAEAKLLFIVTSFERTVVSRMEVVCDCHTGNTGPN